MRSSAPGWARSNARRTQHVTSMTRLENQPVTVPTSIAQSRCSFFPTFNQSTTCDALRLITTKHNLLWESNSATNVTKCLQSLVISMRTCPESLFLRLVFDTRVPTCAPRSRQYHPPTWDIQLRSRGNRDLRRQLSTFTSQNSDPQEHNSNQ